MINKLSNDYLSFDVEVGGVIYPSISHALFATYIDDPYLKSFLLEDKTGDNLKVIYKNFNFLVKLPSLKDQISFVKPLLFKKLKDDPSLFSLEYPLKTDRPTYEIENAMSLLIDEIKEELKDVNR